ncbi:MAG: ATP-binding protein [Theionarchaea archaeon]|nr:MAG: hypothetical protein AYK19_15115 [Theionarchaea archaeon DG-70-1]MBU7029873.1 ATP-binding protein [Theionarchaea archaeon]
MPKVSTDEVKEFIKESFRKLSIEERREFMRDIFEEMAEEEEKEIAEETLPQIPVSRPPLGLSMAAMEYFKIKREPFFMDDIPVNLIQKWDLLVKTRGIKDMNGLMERFLNDKKSRIVLVEGHRGSGKSTAVNYLISELLKIKEEEGIFILSCSVDIPKARPSHEEIKRYVHKTLLRTLIDKIQSLEYAITGVAQAEEAFKGEDFVQIDHEIHRLLYAISSTYKRIILFIDNLDKSDPRNWVEVEQYFSSHQAFYTSKLMSGLQKDSYIYVVVTAQKWMGTWLVNQVQYMMGGMEIRLGEWLLRETNLLFKKRIQWASDKEINPKYYFESPALTYIHTINQALPRYVMRAWQQILNKAAEEKEQPIRLKFCKKYRELVKGIDLESDLASNVEILDKRLRREYPKTYKKLFRCLEKVEAEHVLSVMDTLISIYLSKYTDDKPSADLLLKHGLIEEMEIKEGEINRYKVTKLVEKMFKITEEQFKGDSEAISLLLYEWM